MDFSNVYFLVILISVVGFYLLDLVANLLNLKALNPELPAEMKDVWDAEEYRKSQNYTRTGTRFDLFQGAVSLLFFLAFWLLGGFRWFDGWLESLGQGTLVTGLLCFALLTLVTTLLSLPFEIYETFVIEERFGFNKVTPALFVRDQIRNLFLSALIGLPLAAAVLWFFGKQFPMVWLWAWLVVTAFMLLLQYLAPRLILPLYNKFSPLENDELEKKIEAMAERCEFPVTEVSIVDGSKRSAKANAYFTGFGKNKKIALFDTLVEEQEDDELVSVLAHEIGHFKCGHIIQRTVVMVVQMAVIFFLLGLFLEKVDLYRAFGIERSGTGVLPVHFGLLFFFMLFKPVSRLLAVFSSIWSRRHEYEADAFARKHMGGPGALVRALKKLSLKNLSNLTPHPFYAFLYYSHPTLLERLQALQAGEEVPQ